MSSCAEPSRDYVDIGIEHFAAELQLDNDQQIAKICEALELNIVEESMQPVIKIPKVSGASKEGAFLERISMHRELC